MSWDEIIDPEVIQNPSYWFLTVGAELALMIGFKTQDAWGNGAMPFYTKLIVLAAVPIAAYVITLMIGRR